MSPWITNESQKNKGNDHQLKRVLIVKKISSWYHPRKCIENSMENINSNVWVERIKEDDYETICGSITGT